MQVQAIFTTHGRVNPILFQAVQSQQQAISWVSSSSCLFMKWLLRPITCEGLAGHQDKAQCLPLRLVWLTVVSLVFRKWLRVGCGLSFRFSSRAFLSEDCNLNILWSIKQGVCLFVFFVCFSHKHYGVTEKTSLLSFPQRNFYDYRNDILWWKLNLTLSQAQMLSSLFPPIMA